MESTGQVLGFDVVGVSRHGDTVQITLSAGDVLLPDGKRRHYPAAGEGVGIPRGARRARVCFIDAELTKGAFEDGANAWPRLRIDFDASTPRGVYPGGLIVAAIVKVPAMDKRTRAAHAVQAKQAFSDRATAMAEIRAEFDRWQARKVRYDNDAAFALAMGVKYANQIKNEGSIKNACVRWRKAKKSSN